MGGLSDVENADGMSKRAHLWLRVAALVVIGALACIPRGSQASDAAAKAAPEMSHAVHASVATR